MLRSRHNEISRTRIYLWPHEVPEVLKSLAGPASALGMGDPERAHDRARECGCARSIYASSTLVEER